MVIELINSKFQDLKVAFEENAHRIRAAEPLLVGREEPRYTTLFVSEKAIPQKKREDVLMEIISLIQTIKGQKPYPTGQTMATWFILYPPSFDHHPIANTT